MIVSILSDGEYDEYCRLLAAWVEAEKVVKRLESPDAEAFERSRQAHEAVTRFREEHSMPTAAGDGRPMRITEEQPPQRWAEQAG